MVCAKPKLTRVSSPSDTVLFFKLREEAIAVKLCIYTGNVDLATEHRPDGFLAVRSYQCKHIKSKLTD